jgi:hypothetical protein
MPMTDVSNLTATLSLDTWTFPERGEVVITDIENDICIWGCVHDE